MSTLQVYKVNEDDYINDENLNPKHKELCETFIFEISDIDMANLNSLVWNSNKRFPLDGLNSKELWNFMIETGLKLNLLYDEELIDIEFKKNMMELLNKFSLFSMLPDNIKLKRVESEVK